MDIIFYNLKNEIEELEQLYEQYKFGDEEVIEHFIKTDYVYKLKKQNEELTNEIEELKNEVESLNEDLNEAHEKYSNAYDVYEMINNKATQRIIKLEEDNLKLKQPPIEQETTI